MKIICTAIATKRHGTIVNPQGIDLIMALEYLKNGHLLTEMKEVSIAADAIAAIDQSRAAVMVEATTLNIENGEPARTHIMHALSKGKHVVTANKGPLAFAAKELQACADQHQRCLRYESTVMDGAPIFNLVTRTLPLVKISRLRGIVNSTTNFILTAMEQGNNYAEALAEAQAHGIAEADASLDIEGWDAAVKATVLANCLMGADIHPHRVMRKGIRELDNDRLIQARARGNKIRLVTTIVRENQGVVATVAPTELLPGDLLFFMDACSNALILETDLMGTIAMVEENPELTQTAYGLLSDLLSILPDCK